MLIYFIVGKVFDRLSEREIESTLTIYNVTGLTGAHCAVNLTNSVTADDLLYGYTTPLYGYTTPGCNYAPNAFFLSVVLFVGTFLVATKLKNFKEYIYNF